MAELVINKINLNIPVTLEAEVVWAMPARRTLGQVTPEDATLEVCNEHDGTFIPLVVTDGSMTEDGRFETAAAFIRLAQGEEDAVLVLRAT